MVPSSEGTGLSRITRCTLGFCRRVRLCFDSDEAIMKTTRRRGCYCFGPLPSPNSFAVEVACLDGGIKVG